MRKYFLIALTLFTFLALVTSCTEDIFIPDEEYPYPIPPDTTNNDDPWDPWDPMPIPPDSSIIDPWDPIDPTPVDPTPIPGNIPASMEGYWFNGVFSLDEFWQYDGTYVGKISENARAFVFNPNGESELYVTSMFRPTVGCKVETFSHFKGSIVFDEANQSFTLTPTSGNYRVFSNCAPSQNLNRPATEEELVKNTTTYYYHFEEIGGINYMVVKFNPTDTHGSYFKRPE